MMTQSLANFLSHELALQLSSSGVLGDGAGVPAELKELGQLVMDNTGKFIDEEIVLEATRRITDEEIVAALRRFYEQASLTLTERCSDVYDIHNGEDHVAWVTVSNDSGRARGRVLVTSNNIPSVE